MTKINAKFYFLQFFKPKALYVTNYIAVECLYFDKNLVDCVYS